MDDTDPHLETLSVAELFPAPWNARRHFDTTALADLGRDLRLNGQSQPILVRPRTADGYEVVAGERRRRAALHEGLPTLLAVVAELSDEEAKRRSLAENLNRIPLNPYEETVGILELLADRLAGTSGWPLILAKHGSAQKSVIWVLRNCTDTAKYAVELPAHHLKMDPTELRDLLNAVFGQRAGMTVGSFVNNRLPLLKLPPEVQEALKQGRLEYTKASAIGRHKDPQQRNKLLQSAIDEGLTLAAINERARELRTAADDDSMEQLAAARRSFNRYRRYAELAAPKERRKAAKLLQQVNKLLGDVALQDR